MFRKSFIALASAFAAAGTRSTSEAAVTPQTWTPPLLPLLVRGDYDYDGMMRAVTSEAPHKQVFLSNPSLLTAPGVAGVFQKMSMAWTAYEFALAQHKRQDLSMVGVLIAEPVVFALNDAMWKKYNIGSVLNLRDRSGAIATTNFSRPAWWNLDLTASPTSATSIYHDFTSQALQKRGAHFLVCHNALAGISARFATATGIPHATVLADWTGNLFPGFVAVPSGALAIQLAQERGYKLYPITD